MICNNYIKEIIIMALEPGYTYSTSNVTGSTGPLDVKSSTSAPLVNFSRTVTVTGTLTSLPAEQCQMVTLLISGSTLLYFSINSGSAMQPIPNHPMEVEVVNTNQIQVSGSTSTLNYIVSK